MIKLKNPLKLNAKISKVHLPKRGSEPKGNVSVAGWGDTFSDRLRPMPAEILRTVDLKTFDNRLCEMLIGNSLQGLIAENKTLTEEQKEESIKTKFSLSKTTFCASGPLYGGKGTCEVK